MDGYVHAYYTKTVCDATQRLCGTLHSGDQPYVFFGRMAFRYSVPLRKRKGIQTMKSITNPLIILLLVMFTTTLVGCKKKKSSTPANPTGTFSCEVTGDTVVLRIACFQGPNLMNYYTTTDTAPLFTCSFPYGSYTLLAIPPVGDSVTQGYTVDPGSYTFNLPTTDTAPKVFVMTAKPAPQAPAPVDPYDGLNEDGMEDSDDAIDDEGVEDDGCDEDWYDDEDCGDELYESDGCSVTYEEYENIS